MAVQRLNRLTDLLGVCLAGLVMGIAAVLVVDGVGALLGFGKFGDISGWLAVVLPVLTLAQQFSVAKGERGRIPVTILAILAAAAAGLMAAAVFAGLPPIASGAIGALVATLVYVTVWHVGLAMAANR